MSTLSCQRSASFAEKANRGNGGGVLALNANSAPLLTPHRPVPGSSCSMVSTGNVGTAWRKVKHGPRSGDTDRKRAGTSITGLEESTENMNTSDSTNSNGKDDTENIHATSLLRIQATPL
ncbi:hypothetical protein J1614_011027 [Plenodomus biglobosus]|nr:hypothetical protein J1614_011027 [Plenodomus biglobosus]